MKMSEALKTVARAYVPGIDEHYSKFDPDPWQIAHDNLRATLDLKDELLTNTGLEIFVSNCLELIESFKKLNAPAKQISNADAFHIGDENRFREMWSRKNKECVKCCTKNDLQIINSQDGYSAVVICGACKGGQT